MLMFIPITLAPPRMHLNPLQICNQNRYSEWPAEDVRFVLMAPQTFLMLAEGDFIPQAHRLERIRQCLLRGEELSALPWLEVGSRGDAGICVAHDGRHRARAAAELQLPLIPVALRPAPGSDSLRNLRTLWGQQGHTSVPKMVRITGGLGRQEIHSDYHAWNLNSGPHALPEEES